MEKITFDFSAEIDNNVVLLVAVYKLGYKYEIEGEEGIVETEIETGEFNEDGTPKMGRNIEYVRDKIPNPETPEQYVERMYKMTFENMLKQDFAIASQIQAQELARNITIFK